MLDEDRQIQPIAEPARRREAGPQINRRQGQVHIEMECASRDANDGLGPFFYRSVASLEAARLIGNSGGIAVCDPARIADSQTHAHLLASARCWRPDRESGGWGK